MKIKISLLFLAGGFFFISLFGIQSFKSNSKQSEAMATAIEVVRAKENKQQLLDKDSAISQKGEILGILQLPSIGEELPIVKGVSEEALERGVGYYEGTALPDKQDQIVLSGHRDTVFKRLGELQIGDEVIVEMSYGKFTYIIEETFVVEADDRTVIRPTAPIEKLTITTCYPFNFIGNAPQRYIVNAIRKG
jgi:sortase A